MSVQKCLDGFPLELDADGNDILDELGRFKIWRGNVSAHCPAYSRRSLECRLRDSFSLKKTVLSFLEYLEKALEYFREVSLKPHPLPTESDPVKTASGDDDDCSYHSNVGNASEEMFELSDESDTKDTDLIQSALDRVHEIITCLFCFSMALRDPGRADATRNGPDVDYFVAHATEHVRAKFPTAPEFLVERLGRAIAAHRQYFKYRETHHELLLEEIKEKGLKPENCRAHSLRPYRG